MKRMRILALIVLTAIPAAAQRFDEGKFALLNDGQQIGSASYQIDAAMMHRTVTADFSYTVSGVKIALHRVAKFDAQWEPLEETDAGTANATDIRYSIAPDAAKTRLNFEVSSAGQKFHADFALNPRTVALANFDPSGIQVLLNLMHTNPPPNGKFWAFAPMGRGAVVAADFAAAPDAAAKFDGKPTTAKHSTLTLAGVTMDIYSTADGALLEANIPAQDVAYVRASFALAAVTTPAPVAAAAATVPPHVIEREITFPTDGLTAPGTLTMPESASPTARVPIAVLVQGSGVQDRDETVGRNRVFQQLAWALAERGIATVRYDRRPKFALENFQQHEDLDHEVVIDAANALAFASAVPQGNPTQVFLIGHSLGAQLGPYIVERRLAQKPGSVRGMVLLAGIETPIDQTMLRQIAEMGHAQGATDDTLKPILADWQEVFAKARDPKVPDSQPLGVGVQLPATYWRDWMRRDPAKVMREHPVPTLVLRGDLDINTTHADYTALLEAAKRDLCSEGQEFPGLNHVFMPNRNELEAGQISPAVEDTIATWIHHSATCK